MRCHAVESPDPICDNASECVCETENNVSAYFSNYYSIADEFVGTLKQYNIRTNPR